MIRELFALYTVYCAHFALLKTCNLVPELNASASKFWPLFKTATNNKQNDPFPIAFTSVRRSNCSVSVMGSSFCTILFISTPVCQSDHQIIADRGIMSPVKHFVYLQLACDKRVGCTVLQKIDGDYWRLQSIRKITLPLQWQWIMLRKLLLAFFMFYTKQSCYLFTLGKNKVGLRGYCMPSSIFSMSLLKSL